MNEFRLQGTISKIFTRKTTTNKYVAKITVKIESAGRNTYVSVSFWDDLAYQIIDHAPQGSEVKIVGFLSDGSYKDQQGATKYLTNVTAKTFEVIKRAQREEYQRPSGVDDDIDF